MTTPSNAPVSVVNLLVDRITASKTNRPISQAEIDEMAASIQLHGVLQPIVVRSVGDVPFPNGVTHQIIAGEKRWRGAILSLIHI